MARVYWAARDLNGPPVGNHHFVLIVLDEGETLPGIPTKIEIVGSKVVRFVTLGAFKVDGRLKFEANNNADVTSMREYTDPGEHVSWYKADFDMERNAVSVAGKTGIELARQLVQFANNYVKNEDKSNVAYDLANENCSAWVNSILKKAGVTSAARVKAGEFFGFDWGEEDAVPATLFD